ncbi:MAG: ATP-binding cassette domain-containing protein [Thermoguttaceae bacterium]
MDAIRTERLSRSFDGITAVDQLTLSVAEGEIFGLVGPDGAGKTTTMRLLAAVLEPSGGDAWVAGLHVVRQAEAIKPWIGYMSQRFGLYADLTVIENLEFYADIYDVPRRGRRERIERLLAFSHLGPFRRRLAGNLSGGMQKKLGLACALVHTPKVLFLDEPTGGVDPVSRRELWRILYQLLRQRVTIFVSTAYLDEAERCNRVGLIHRGTLLACGTPEQVKQSIQAAILELRTLKPRRAAAVLRASLPGASVGLFGDRVHLVAAGLHDAAAEVSRVLAAAGLPVEDIRPIEPSLEDVFVCVAGHEQTGFRVQGSGLSQQGPEPRGGQAGETPPGSGGAGDAHPPERRILTPEPPPPDSKARRTPPAEKAVVVRDLEKRFGSFVAVNRISFEVARGEIFGFLGPNGAGKSTTIRMLCGILAPTAGWGTVAGFDIRCEPEQIKATIGYMSQKFSLYQDLTVEENIDFYSGIYRIPAPQKQARKQWVLRMAGLEEHRGRPTAVLSAGWKQRLALGCAILHHPPIVFLDEPTSGVDPSSRRQFWELIYDMADQGVTVFVTTHYMDEAEYCDRLALIYRGELIATGTPAELKTTVMKDQVLEVACDRPEQAMELVEKLTGVKEAALFGKGLHVVAEDAQQTSASIRDALAAHGFGLQRLQRIVPSLEDVFVRLIEARDRAGQPQPEVGR